MEPGPGCPSTGFSLGVSWVRPMGGPNGPDATRALEDAMPEGAGPSARFPGGLVAEAEKCGRLSAAGRAARGWDSGGRGRSGPGGRGQRPGGRPKGSDMRMTPTPSARSRTWTGT